MRIRSLVAAGLLPFLGVFSASAQSVGRCDLGAASAELDVNNVRARVLNTGGLFWRGSESIYTVPKDGPVNALFAANLWIGGLVNGEELRFAGTAYGPWEFWPGPLDAGGNPPHDCDSYDRIYSVYREDVERMLQAGEPTEDVLDWPGDLGAPFVDANENGTYDPESGDYPDITGDQTLWWVMNDVGAPKGWSQTAPIGLEVQVTAFAFQSNTSVNNTTFYKYKLIHKGDDPFEDVYLGFFVDPDVGDAHDDFVGSDTTLGMAFAYNADDFDAGIDGYGDRPAAVGFDFLKGPLVPASGRRWADPDGATHEDSVRLQMTHFLSHRDGFGLDGSPDPTTDDPYQYLQGLWRDGSPITYGGSGYGGSEPTDFMFPGDPVMREYWSEENVDGLGTRRTPADRRFVMSTGPFTLNPGDIQEVILGIVWARASDRLTSVLQLRRSDMQAQGLYYSNFNLTPSPDAPILSAEPMPGAVALTWSNPKSSNNYLNSYDHPSSNLVALEPDGGDTTYTFEGYKLYQYDSTEDQDGEMIAIYDEKNGIRKIGDDVLDPDTGFLEYRLVANGSDSGIQQYLAVDGLTNYKEYTFGVQAYVYNPNSRPRVLESPVAKVTVAPMKPNARDGLKYRSIPGDIISATTAQGTGSRGGVFAKVVDPSKITGDVYEIHVYEAPPPDSSGATLTFDIVNATTESVEVSGTELLEMRGRSLEFGEDVALIDGLSFTVTSSKLDLDQIVEVATPVGPIEPDNVWHDPNSDGDYYVSSFSSGDLTRLKHYLEIAAQRDFEIRFTDQGGYGAYAFQSDIVATTPFELWDVGKGTPNDPSDDRRMIPFLRTDGPPPNTWGWATGTDSWGDNPASDAIFFMDPQGQDGYSRFAAIADSVGSGGVYPTDSANRLDAYFVNGYDRIEYPIGEVVLADLDGDGDPPPPGTVIRFETTKPLTHGDVLRIDTQDLAPIRDVDILRAAIEKIGVVPNPYRGASAYEVSSSSEEVRFTNLPEEAIVRVFTLSGTLVRQMRLSSFDNSWDLRNDKGYRIASGIYLIHIEVPDVGEQVVKFGVVRTRIGDSGR